MIDGNHQIISFKLVSITYFAQKTLRATLFHGCNLVKTTQYPERKRFEQVVAEPKIWGFASHLSTKKFMFGEKTMSQLISPFEAESFCKELGIIPISVCAFTCSEHDSWWCYHIVEDIGAETWATQQSRIQKLSLQAHISAPSFITTLENIINSTQLRS